MTYNRHGKYIHIKRKPSATKQKGKLLQKEQIHGKHGKHKQAEKSVNLRER